MPRSPTVYTLPPGTTPQQPNTVIGSTMFNAAMDDIASTFNTVQPVEFGGTGATNAVGGADNLSPDFVNVASAATTNIGAAASPNVNITGTTTITAFDTAQAGARRWVKFASALTLTHNATSLILPGAANITTTAGDTAVFVSEGAGNWRCVGYQKADGFAVSPSAPVVAGLRAFLNLTGTGTPTATNSYNVSSITDNGAGDYTINFTTAIGSTDYPFWITIADSYVASTNIRGWQLSARASASLRIIFAVLSTSFGATPADLNNIFIAVARGS